MPLPQFRKYVLVNNSGQTLTYNNNGRINIKETAWHFEPTDGKIVYTQLVDDDLGFTTGGSLTNTSEIVGDVTIDNTSNLYIGSQIQIEITHDEGTAAFGTFDLYLSEGDASGELQTDRSGYGSANANRLRLIGSLLWDSNGLDDEVMSSPIFHIGG